MRPSSSLLADVLLQYGTQLGTLRRVPVIGDVLSWASKRLVPHDTLTWGRIEEGPLKGLWIRVNPRTGHFVKKGISEREVQRAMVDVLRPGMTFYDLGANIGFFSLLAGRLVGVNGHVIAFEVDPEIAARLRENLSRNNMHHAQVVQKAIWSECAEVLFVRADPLQSPDRGLGKVSRGGGEFGAIRVEAVSLDDFTVSHPAPDVVKCDVEGAEVAAFQGASNLLSNKHPILIVETHSAENRRTLVAKFVAGGYTCRSLSETHLLALPH